MTSKAAKIDILQLLHAEVADRLRTALHEEPSPQMLAQAIKFLQVNGIEPARDADSKALQDLSDQISEIAANGDADDVRDLLN